jgi:hypothetical protein
MRSAIRRSAMSSTRSAARHCCGPQTAAPAVVCGDPASDGGVAAQPIVEAFPWTTAAAYLVRDNEVLTGSLQAPSSGDGDP